MHHEMIRVDVSGDPKLRDLAQEVRRTQQPRLLDADGEGVAMVVPVRPGGRRPRPFTPTTRDELRSIFGAPRPLRQSLTWEETKAIAEEDAAGDAVRGW